MNETADASTMLDARLEIDTGSLSISIDLRLPGHAITAIIGPNGAGKTTLLRALAGLVLPDAGRVALGATVFDDVAAGEHLPTERRRVGMVFQNHRLFPNLTARENIAFGPRVRKMNRNNARTLADDWLRRFDLEGSGGRLPRELSAGQAQRVALARALASSPALVLLDEPLSALDAATRISMRADLREHLRELTVPTVLVTHDIADAAAIADEIVVMESGRITQRGTLAAIAADPCSNYVQEFLREL
jgi:molybdate transport system ATP-binding protein